MLKRFPEFDTSRLKLLQLAEREHDLNLDADRSLQPAPDVAPVFSKVGSKIVNAVSRRSPSAVVLMMGAHVLRAGVQRYIIDLMERDYITCVAMNGAGVIHDFELALIGATTEKCSPVYTGWTLRFVERDRKDQ